jgi:hypothetical protein
MTNADLETVISRTGHERFRWLVSEENSDVVSREGYRRLVARLASGDDQPAPSYPPIAEQAANAAKAAGRFVASGLKTVDKAEYERRLAICKACDQYDAKQARCVLCGCRTKYKLRMATESCPLDPPKWLADPWIV